jgi:PST family polysaccharide transporter
MEQSSDSGKDLKRASVHAGAWAVFGSAFSSLVGMLVFMFLSKLVTPEEIGVVAIVDVVLGLGLRALSTGLTEPLVQFPRLERKHIDTLFWAILLFGWILCLLMMQTSSTIAQFFHYPALSNMLAVSGITLYMQAMVLVPQALLARDMQFATIARASIQSDWISGLVAITAALAGVGVWALILQRLVQTFLNLCFVVFATRFSPQLQYSQKHFRELIGFSASRLADNFVLYCDQNAPRFLLGYFAGPAALGYFAFARNISDSVLKTLSMPIRTIALSTLSKVQSDTLRVRAIYNSGLSFTAGLLAPCGVGVACIAPEIVEFFGAKWSEATFLIQLLAIASLRNIFQVWNASILRALGFPRALLMLTLLRAVTSFTLSWLLLPYGAIGVCWAIQISGFLTSPFAMSVTRTTLKMRWWEQIKPAVPPFLAAACMALCLTICRIWFLDHLPLYFRSVLLVLIGCASYLTFTFFIDRTALATWAHYFTVMLKGRVSS